MARPIQVSDFQRMMSDEQATGVMSTARVTVDGSGSVTDVRPAEMTPDRGDVTRKYRLADDGQRQNYDDLAGVRSDENPDPDSGHTFGSSGRFSGGGADVVDDVEPGDGLDDV